jgi:hypothetical protein
MCTSIINGSKYTSCIYKGWQLRSTTTRLRKSIYLKHTLTNLCITLASTHKLMLLLSLTSLKIILAPFALSTLWFTYLGLSLLSLHQGLTKLKYKLCSYYSKLSLWPNPLLSITDFKEIILSSFYFSICSIFNFKSIN